VIVAVYGPGWALLLETVRLTVEVEPGNKLTVLALNVTVGPNGFTVDANVTVPVKLPGLVRVSVEVPEDPDPSVRYDGLAVRRTLGRVVVLAIIVDQQLPAGVLNF
jgi:hypothetical protein